MIGVGASHETASFSGLSAHGLSQIRAVRVFTDQGSSRLAVMTPETRRLRVGDQTPLFTRVDSNCGSEFPVSWKTITDWPNKAPEKSSSSGGESAGRQDGD